VDIFLGESGDFSRETWRFFSVKSAAVRRKNKPARCIFPPRTRFDTTRIPQERGGNKLIFFSLKRGKFQGKKNARAAGNGKIKRYSVQHKSELCKISLATV
jgi:hypothetical protein